MEPSRLSTKAIREYAERVADHYGIFNSEDCADVRGLVKRLGGRVDVSSSLFNDEALTVHAPGDFTIHLPQLTSDRRDRFTIAHELGHYFLHYLQPERQGPMSYGRGSRNQAETQANYFAASLLMPEARFRAAYERLQGDMWKIGDSFGVSPQAAGVRAQVLGLD